MLKFALAGNPNSGKTTLFNNLTGSTAHVGNWPGVTVDKREGLYKKLEEDVSIVDLPGIYSLSPYTSEEVVSRNFILDEKPECVINIVDATNLERNLYLTTQLLEIEVPVVIALNMMDVLEHQGIEIDIKTLEREIGVPVVGISAMKGEGTDELMLKAYEAYQNKRKPVTVLENTALMHLIKDCTSAFKGLKVDNPLFHAIKLVESDEVEVKDHPNLCGIVDEFKRDFNDPVFGNDLEAIIADARYSYIVKNYTVAKCRTKLGSEKLTKSDKADRILTSKWLGFPIFLIILFLIFHLTFSENLFWFGGLIKSDSFSNSEFFSGAIWHEGGINSPGVMLQSLLTGFTDFLTSVVEGWLANAPSWLSGLVCNGILAGVFSVLSFLPQILLLFLFFSILEDTGYMARIAFILDRICRRYGLSGRAFIPMIMGFGCGVPAMINCRTLGTDNEKTATIRVIPFFSCGAKLPILTAIAGGICSVWGFKSVDLITYSMYVMGILIALLSVFLMRKTTMRGKVPPFIMELPNYHLPQAKSLFLHLWDKMKHFIEKAFTIILASTILIWFLQSFTFDWRYIEVANPSEMTNETYETMLEDATYKAKVDNYFETYSDNEEVDFATMFTRLEELNDSDSLSSQEVAEKNLLTDIVDSVFTVSLAQYQTTISNKDYVDTGDSILAGVGKVITPVFTPLGWGSNLDRETGWVYPVSAITGLIAKENVIATFSVLAQSVVSSKDLNMDNFKEIYATSLDEEGITASVEMIKNTGANQHWAILISFIVFNMTTIPCFASVATAKAELPKGKFKSTILFWLATSYIASTVIYLVLRWWWTVFIVLGLAALVGVGIYLFNKNKDKKLAGVN